MFKSAVQYMKYFIYHFTLCLMLSSPQAGFAHLTFPICYPILEMILEFMLLLWLNF